MTDTSPDLAERRPNEPVSMRATIVSDGTAAGTVITDADTGQRVEGLVAAHWYCRLDGPAQVVLVRRRTDRPGPPERVHATAALTTATPVGIAADDLAKLRTAIGLLDSMVRAGEQHSERSEADVEAAREVLRRLAT